MGLLFVASARLDPSCDLAGARRACVAMACGLLLSSPIRAEAEGATDRAATAQGLYESAASLMKAGNPAAACPKLEESQRLDPAMGTQFFLAICYESTGRPTSAWSLFLDVATAARAAGNPLRETTARSRAAALEPKLPRIAVTVAEADAALPGLTVERDGAALKPVVWGSLIPVDLGEHTVRATATGRAPWSVAVIVRELGQKVEVKVPPLAEGAPLRASPAAPADDERPDTTARPDLPGQKVAGLLVGSVGVGSLVIGGVLGLMTRSVWNQAEAACPTHAACSVDAHDESARALSLATGSTVTLAAGGAAVAGGLILWFTTPSRRPTGHIQVVPIGAGAVGAFASGSF